jgi:uncharacterized protein (DUF885 family)
MRSVMRPSRLSLVVVLASSVATIARAQVPIAPALREAADSVVALSRPTGAPRPWGDPSDDARIAFRLRQDRITVMLERVDRAALATSEDRLLLDNLSEVIAGARASRICRFHLWYSPSPFAGWHIAASNWARNVRVADSASRATALSALRELPAAMEAERSLLARGADSGYVSSAQVVMVVRRQFADLTPEDVARSPLFAPAERDATAAFRAAWAAVLRDDVYPAVRRYEAYLAGDYAVKARADGSLAAQREGTACYRATLRERTSVDADPLALLQDSRDEIGQIHRELGPLVRRLTGAGDVSDGVRVLKSDARFTFASRDSVLAAYQAMTALAATRIDRVVAGYAPESVVVIAYPEFQERAGLPPSYQRAPDDRSRPAHFLVNLSRTERMAVANAAAHEAYPGHHLQRIAASQATSIHPVMRSLSVSAFSEGWGIYAEDLGHEMGLYVSDLDRVGHLVHRLDVAVAYYLDAGAHMKGWTRAQLIDSMYVLGGRSREQAADYADRHAATPGQLATYYVGYRTIRAARADAERRLGVRFRLPEFNREVLRDGTITLASLRAKLDAWVSAREGAAP